MGRIGRRVRMLLPEPEGIRRHVDALDEPGEVARAAQQTILTYPLQDRQNSALIAIADGVDEGMGDLEGRMARAEEHCAAVMAGEGTECRHLTKLQNRVLTWIVVMFVGAVALAGILGILGWSIDRAMSKPAASAPAKP